MSTPERHFGDDLVLAIRDVGHPLCVGIDPLLDRIPALFRPAGAAGSMDPRDPETADTVEAFGRAIVDRAAGRVAIVKPQIAFFEALGWRGLRALTRVCEHARAQGLAVLLDAKRGDIGSTAEGYARAYLEPDAPLPVEAITLNPYLGTDTLEPFVAAARDHGRGLFILVKTSNPGSGDFQDVAITVEGAPLFASVADALAPISESLRGPKTGWSSLGAVVGATYPGEAEEIRQRLPHTLFLIPGYGAQGASAADAVASFKPGPAGLEGGLVNSSRAILYPAGADGAASAADWERHVDGALDRAIDDLGEAVRA